MSDKELDKGKQVPESAAQFMPTSVRATAAGAGNKKPATANTSSAKAGAAAGAGATATAKVAGAGVKSASGEKPQTQPGKERNGQVKTQGAPSAAGGEKKPAVGAAGVAAGAAAAAGKGGKPGGEPEKKPEKPEKKGGLFGGLRDKVGKGGKGGDEAEAAKPEKKKGSLFGKKNKDSGESIKGSINKSLGLSAEGVQEVQQRLEKLTLAVTVAAAVTIFAIIFAGWTAWQSFSTTQALKSSMRSVVVAVEEIPSGTTITKDMLGMLDVPARYLSADATSDAGQLVGQRANVTISANDQVTPKMVSGSGNTSSASAQLTSGEKAITIKVDDATGIAGLIKQGDRVNVISSNKGQVRTIVSKVRVVALDNYLSGSKGSYRYVTVALTSDQVHAVRQAESVAGAKLSLALNPAGSADEQ